MAADQWFSDVLKSRRRESSNFMWASRQLNPSLAYKQCTKANPNQHVAEALRSRNLIELFKKVCAFVKSWYTQIFNVGNFVYISDQ